MNEAWRKLVLSSVICYAVAFGLAVLFSVFEFSTETVLPDFQLNWIFSNAWSQFLTLIPVAQAWAVMITFSLAVPMTAARLTGTSFEKFGSSIVVVLVFGLVFAGAYAVAHPMAVSARKNVEFSSRDARRLREEYDAADRAQDHLEARIKLEQYVLIAGENAETEEMMRRITRLAEQDATRLAQDTSGPTREDGPAGARALVDRALAAADAEDYSTAHYLAVLARSLDPENSEAPRLAADALQRLGESLPDDEENAQAALFREIHAAKEAFERGDTILAYYLFKRLKDDNLGNADISRYFEEVSLAVQDLAIFKGEITPVVTTVGTPGFTFVNDTSGDEIELISIGKLVRLRTGTYAQGFELLRFDRSGNTVRHVSSEFGKLYSDTMILTVSDPDDQTGDIPPVVYVADPLSDPENAVRLSPEPDELWLMGAVSADPAAASVPDLVRMLRSNGQFGLIPELAGAELLHRLSLPFVFLVLSILVLGFSWRYRSRYIASPPAPAYILLPAAPLVLAPAYLLLLYGHRLLFSSLLLWTGFTIALVTFIILEGLLLAASLTYLALSARE
jgi:hypothetical protein